MSETFGTKKNPYTISAIAKTVSAIFKNNAVFHNFYLKANVKSANEHKTSVNKPMVFLTLTDTSDGFEYESLATIPYFNYEKDKYTTKDLIGNEILIRASCSFYDRRSQFQFEIQEVIQIGGKSVDERKKEELYKKLVKEKLIMTPEKRKPIPRFPTKIAIITGRDSAAFNDVMFQFQKRYPFAKYELFLATVQGDNAISSIILELDKAEKESDLDFILITRGGGSKTDLAPFDSEALVMRVVSAKVPIITAIGHEIDKPLIDLVADYNYITPTEAAKELVPDILDIKKDIENINGVINKLVNLLINKKEQKYHNILNILKDNNPIVKYQEKVYEKERKLISYAKDMNIYILSLISRSLENLNKEKTSLRNNITSLLKNKEYLYLNQKNKLLENNPEKILEKGYHEIKNALTKKKIKSVDDININDDMITTLKDGIIISKVKEKKKGR